MLRPADLVEEADFGFGPLVVSPSRRLVIAHEEQRAVEPRVMQVLVLLARDAGKVVSRQELFEQVWGGVAVGDDSLNRAVSGVRKALDLAPGAFDLETVPRTGYRLSVIGEGPTSPQPLGDDDAETGYDRRWLLFGGPAALAVVAGGTWFASRERAPSPEAQRAIERGLDVLRRAMPGTEDRAIEAFTEAARIDDRSARAWGLLAMAYRMQVENGGPDKVTLALEAAQRAARRALQLDDKEGNARVALATLRPEYGDWLSQEKALLRVLDDHPDNFFAHNSLALLFQSVGRVSDGFEHNEIALSLDPLSVTPHYRGALKHWILGDNGKAEQVMTRSLSLWPNHPIFWHSRLIILAFSGRAREALDFLHTYPVPANVKNKPHWELLLLALIDGGQASSERARDAILSQVGFGMSYASFSVMGLSSLGYLDDALDVCNAYYLGRGPYAGKVQTKTRAETINDMGWRRTMMLFTPGCVALRGDPRFMTLMAGMGLVDYWKKTGTRPDAFLFAQKS
ncbi:winged helix-turn-helix domain-containing protein [Sphingomicrobium nitratireducens]|uniref:winged helix-turn-helix domain-containing protein n=1 Tax=Sphingomicrobium nitratireducens TaxID=2964666 RepID=UPI002240DE06|nr:winged helix-turn-helix domain-containing protein [Sphingomicrobium nitratireducens]